MDYPDDYFSKYCAPLWLSKPFMIDGHNADKANGTATFIKYKNRFFVVTCAHVYHQQKLGTLEYKELMLVGNSRVVVRFGLDTEKGFESSFKSLLDNVVGSYGVDIAIAPANYVVAMYMADNKKAWIDLDSWTKPDWLSTIPKVAGGYATEHKKTDGKYVYSSFLQVVIESPNEIDPLRPTFTMFSELEKDHNVFLSGMSGGPVFSQFSDEREATPVGIIYEGIPGSSEEWRKRDSQSFFTGNHMQISAVMLTPDNFGNWLQQVGFDN